MPTSSITRPARRIGLLTALLLVGCCTPSRAVTLLFAEDFEGLPLQTSPTYGDPFAFTLNPPPGWDRFDELPGLNNPQIGVPEWKGWSFAREDFWKGVAGGARDLFDLAQGTIAVADPDTWNDLGDPANELGFYNTFLTTPTIDFRQVGDLEDRLILQFDTSWNGGDCCDDGQQIPGLAGRNNQKAIIRANFGNGQIVELFRWEAAPYYDNNNPLLPPIPTDQPVNAAGQTNTPNPFFTPFIGSERVFLDLSPLLPSSSLALLTAANASAPIGMSTAGEGVQLEFAMEDAGDDGWWAVDNVEMASFESLLGDMDLSGVLDSDDIDAFALGMLDTNEYRFNYFGEFPVARGSLDSSFDFEDIPWFNGVMEGAGVSGAAMALARALNPVPEPTTAVLAVAVLSALSLRVRQG